MPAAPQTFYWAFVDGACQSPSSSGRKMSGGSQQLATEPTETLGSYRIKTSDGQAKLSAPSRYLLGSTPAIQYPGISEDYLISGQKNRNLPRVQDMRLIVKGAQRMLPYKKTNKPLNKKNIVTYLR